jgi:Rrf2 family transcriptional repressor of oqxAB
VLDLRFPTALQAMLSLALAHESGISRMTSAELAEGLGANPSLVRRLLRQLVDGGLLVSALGKSGGVSLARPATEIALAEIYGAAREGKPLWVPRADIPHRCVVTSNIEAYFAGLAKLADSAVSQVLARSTLADALGELRGLERQRNEKGRPRKRDESSIPERRGAAGGGPPHARPIPRGSGHRAAPSSPEDRRPRGQESRGSGPRN